MASCSEQQGQTTIPMTAAMQRKVMSENLKDVRHKLFVMSGKGGVGKSSVTVNLAAALAAALPLVRQFAALTAGLLG